MDRCHLQAIGTETAGTVNLARRQAMTLRPQESSGGVNLEWEESLRVFSYTPLQVPCFRSSILGR
jgi:hypothetical protein